MNYTEFIEKKSQFTTECGFQCDSLPDFLFDFQRHLVEWSLRRGRSAIFADCGLGKTAMQLTWAQKVVEHTNKRVLILTPLAVANQTEREASKFGFDAKRSIEGELGAKIIVTNYDRLHNFDPQDFVGFVCDESSILKSVDGAVKLGRKGVDCELKPSYFRQAVKNLALLKEKKESKQGAMLF